MPTSLLVPARWEVVGMALLVLGYLTVDALAGEAAYDVLNVVGPAIFAVLLLSGAVRLVLVSTDALWLVIFWFRLATGIYFGLGTVLRHAFDDYTRHLVDAYYWAQPAELFTANLICAVGVLLVLGTGLLFGLLWPPQAPPRVKTASDPLLLFSAVAFCVIGYLPKYLIVVPYSFMTFGATPLPGMLVNLVYIAAVGLFLLTAWCVQYRPSLLILPVALLIADLVAGALAFSKTSVLLPMIIFALGLFSAGATWRKMAAAAVAVLFVFQVTVPMVNYGRAELLVRSGNINFGSFADRLDILTAYVTDPPVRAEHREKDWYSRFYYGNAMAAAITQYDNGNPGRTLRNIFIVLIPRSLWKDKPVFNLGQRFNVAVVGEDSSSTWMGAYAESYCNYGWLGLPLAMIPFGLALHIVARIALTIIRRRQWLHFPIVMAGIWMGMRVDGDILTSQFAGFVAVLLLKFIVDRAEPVVRMVIAVPPALAEERAS